MSPRARLDESLVDRGLAPDLDSARRLVMAGRVRIGTRLAVKPDEPVPPGEEVQVVDGPAYVSRGGEKLAAALAAFALRIEGATCADVGASTGGFTDCLLQAGAAKVYAIDVGRGQLHWKLRNDRRVVVMERTDARSVAALPEPVSLATVDVSFISLRQLLKPVRAWLSAEGELVALVKPQFEAAPSEVDRGGIIRRPATRLRILADALDWMREVDLAPLGLIPSPLLGAKGNQEYLLWARLGGEPVASERLLAGISAGAPD